MIFEGTKKSIFFGLGLTRAGDTIPNTDTLKLLSKEFDVSINTLLGEPRKLICQCCGMPIDDDSILGRDKDGTLNEEYCKWCYADGTYTYNNMDELIDVCVKNMVNENFTEEQARSYLKGMMNLVTMGSLKSLKSN